MADYRDALNAAFPEPDAHFVQVYEQTLTDIARQKKPSGMPTKQRTVVLVAALVLLAAIGVAEGLRTGVLQMLAHDMVAAWGKVQPEAQQLVTPQQSGVSTEHLDVALTEALYDGGTVRFVYTVTLRGATEPLTEETMNDPDGAFMRAVTADGVSLWGPDGFTLDGEYISMTGGSRTSAAPGDAPGQAVCFVEILLASEGIAPKGTFTLDAPVFYGENKGKVLTMTLDADNLPGVLDLTPAQPTEQDGATITLRSVVQSPIRFYIDYQVDLHEGAPERIMRDWMGATIVDGEGKPVFANGGSLSWGPAAPGTDESRHALMHNEYAMEDTVPEQLYFAPDSGDGDFIMGDEFVADMSRAIPLTAQGGE